MTIRRRSEWGSESPFPGRSFTPMGQVSDVFVHHSVTSAGTGRAAVKAVEDVHKAQPQYTGVAYNQLVTQDGTKWEGRGWAVRSGATSPDWNPKSYAICAVGNFHPPQRSPLPAEPTSALLDGIAEIIAEGVQAGHIRQPFTIRGHRDAWSTACPGDSLYAKLPTIRRRVEDLLRAGTPPTLTLEQRVRALELWREDEVDPTLDIHEARLNNQRDNIKRLVGARRGDGPMRRWWRRIVSRKPPEA